MTCIVCHVCLTCTKNRTHQEEIYNTTQQHYQQLHTYTVRKSTNFRDYNTCIKYKLKYIPSCVHTYIAVYMCSSTWVYTYMYMYTYVVQELFTCMQYSCKIKVIPTQENLIPSSISVAFPVKYFLVSSYIDLWRFYLRTNGNTCEFMQTRTRVWIFGNGGTPIY